MPAQATKCVLIAAPHTSNWDLPYTLMVAFALRLNVLWMGKASLFRFGLGPLMRALGGVAVDRSQAHDAVRASAQRIAQANGPVQWIVAPEGTRRKVHTWKTGFHHIARQAGVPILTAHLDYGQRRGGLGPVFEPGDDVQADIARIKAFYAPMKGRNPQQYAPD
ncbi:MAG: lysophospholipid acyltransferase family protein [Rhodoferax sp.]